MYYATGRVTDKENNVSFRRRVFRPKPKRAADKCCRKGNRQDTAKKDFHHRILFFLVMSALSAAFHTYSIKQPGLWGQVKRLNFLLKDLPLRPLPLQFR